MPKRSKKAVQAKRGFGPDPVVRIHGNHLYQNSTAVAVDSLNLNPLLFDARLISLSDTFQEYRFTKLVAHAFQPGNSPIVQIGYTPTLTSTAPTVANLSSLPIYAVGTGGTNSGAGGQMGWPTIRVPRSELASNAPKWFRRGTAYDDLLEAQGSLWFGSSISFSGANMWIWIEYEVEFKANVDPSLTAPLHPQSLFPTTEEKVADQLGEMQRVLGMAARVRNPLPRPMKAVTEQATSVASAAGSSQQSVRIRADITPDTEYELVPIARRP